MPPTPLRSAYLGLAALVLSGLGCRHQAPSATDASGPPLPGLAEICGEGAPSAAQPGTWRDARQLGAIAGRASFERTQEALCGGDQSLLGIGTALYVLAQQRLEGGTGEIGLALLQWSASAYRHPLALIRRSQLRVHALHDMQTGQEGRQSALKAAYLDLQVGRATAIWMSSHLGAEELRQETESKARGLLEAFAAGAVPGSLDIGSAQAAFEEAWPAEERALGILYGGRTRTAAP